ncbi:hypothetical protein TSUD_233760 [Trifolium subterraneum]|uniref:Peptidase M3A/M3B catalytic domain-containing protein n=1 Tax=Trifolium subterraneum TaxID=3900 RepID=A0A2Z6LI08_TRISU|nr:hypothetical protein TSUD_233760 [Trifolium subterraneum]
MTENEGKREKMENIKKTRGIIAFTGTAAVLAIAVNLVITAIKHQKGKNAKKKDLVGSNVRVNLSASEIVKLANQIIAKSNEVHNSVASVPLDKVTYANVISPLAELQAQQFPLIQSCLLPKLVSTREDVRKASAEAERRIDAHLDICSKREDVYLVVKSFAVRGDWINAETKSFVQILVRDFERNGLNLSASKREELLRIKAQIDELSIIYIQNLNDASAFLPFNEAELAGLPPEFLKGLDKSDNGQLKISLRSHHVTAVLEFCKVQQRHKYARLLGYSCYAEYAVDVRMAKSPTKKKEEGEFPFGIEDLLYYVKRVEEQNYDLDFSEIKQYLPISLVLSGIFKIVQDLFGLRFEEIAGAEVWHCDVRVFSVFDLSSSELLGYCYLDLFSREGKYGHSCVVPLQNSALTISGTRQIPVALLISQYQKDSDCNPGLLRFSEVVSLFREFGHVVQHICNRASFARVSGIRVDPDFVEIPAQLLQNCCYESFFLKLISGFHQDITKPLKDDLCKSIKRWRNSSSALKLKQEILYCLPVLEGTNPASCFPFSVVGYEAACYSRIWSEVFAADIFATIFCNGVSNQLPGLQFRNKVLAPGGTKDSFEAISDFLGREPSIKAYIENKTKYTL